MPEKLEENKKKCFIITPIGDTYSETRQQAEGVIDAILCPVLMEQEFNYDVIVPHRVYDSGSITKRIISDIYDSELVIANLTGLNPNVMYETSFRHSCGKPIIHICESGTDLPFDLKDQRTIFYENNLSGAILLKDNLIITLRRIKELREDTDNPIYNGLKNHKIGKLIYEHTKEEFDACTQYFRTTLYRNTEDELLITSIINCDCIVCNIISPPSIYTMVNLILNRAKKVNFTTLLISYLKYGDEIQYMLFINHEDGNLDLIINELDLLFNETGYFNVRIGKRNK